MHITKDPLGYLTKMPSSYFLYSWFNIDQYLRHGNQCTLFISFPRVDASSFLHSEPILNAALAAATAWSTSAYKTSCGVLVWSKTGEQKDLPSYVMSYPVTSIDPVISFCGSMYQYAVPASILENIKRLSKHTKIVSHNLKVPPSLYLKKQWSRS